MAHDTGKQVAPGLAPVALSAVAWSTEGIFTKGVEADVWRVLLWRGLLTGGVVSVWPVSRRRKVHPLHATTLSSRDDQIRHDTPTPSSEATT